MKGVALRVQFSLSGKVLEPRPRHTRFFAILIIVWRKSDGTVHMLPHLSLVLPILFPNYTNLAVDTGQWNKQIEVFVTDTTMSTSIILLLLTDFYLTQIR